MSIERNLDQLEDKIFKHLMTVHKAVINYLLVQVVILFLSIIIYSRFVPFYYWLPPSLAILLLMGILSIFTIYVGAKWYEYLLNERDRAKESRYNKHSADGMARNRKWVNIYMWLHIGLVVGCTFIIFYMLIEVAMGCKLELESLIFMH